MISIDKILEKKSRIAVIGLGYVGLPLAVEFAKNGFVVFGIDENQQKIASLSKLENYIDDINTKDLKEVLQSKKLIPTNDYKCLEDVDACLICVPTPLNKTMEPDMSFIVSAVNSIEENMKSGMLIVLESTTYPGTTEEVILPILSKNGKKMGEDFLLAFSPERIDPGNKQFSITQIPKIVGGMDALSTDVAVSLYSQIINEIKAVSSPSVAETAKLLENTFRTVNIGLINEIALMCHQMEIDVWEVIDAAATKPFGFMPFYPGPGLGGHCLPVDPHYLAWKAKTHDFETQFINLASKINRHMPHFVLQRISEALNTKKKSLNGAKVLVLGVAYKSDVDDIRESPALDVLELLKKQGANIQYSDPHVETLNWDHISLESISLNKKNIEEFDCVVIITAHKFFDYSLIVSSAKLIVDTRNALKDIKEGREKIVKL